MPDWGIMSTMDTEVGANASPDEASVMECVRAFDDAFDSNDYETVATLCTEDFVFIGSGEGEECEGPRAVGPTMSSLMDEVGSRFVSWNLKFPEPQRVTIHGDTAIVVRRGRSELVMADSHRRTRYRLSGVLRRTPDGWKWWLFHGSEAQPW